MKTAQFKRFLSYSMSGEEFVYTSEAERHEERMELARNAAEVGTVVLFRRRLNGELLLVARRVSGKAKRFIRAAPHLTKRREPRNYVPFVQPSGRGLSQLTLPDGFDGPASRRNKPVVGGPNDDGT